MREVKPYANLAEYPIVKFIKTVDHLKDEYSVLRGSLDNIYQDAQSIVEMQQARVKLDEKVIQLKYQLSTHNRKKQNVLLPMLIQYRREQIELYELGQQVYELASNFIDAYLDAMSPYAEVEAKEMASYLCQAYDLLLEYLEIDEKCILKPCDEMMENIEYLFL